LFKVKFGDFIRPNHGVEDVEHEWYGKFVVCETGIDAARVKADAEFPASTSMVTLLYYKKRGVPAYACGCADHHSGLTPFVYTGVYVRLHVVWNFVLTYVGGFFVLADVEMDHRLW
jgi:hypothetical protein